MNLIRSLLGEYGITFPQGVNRLREGLCQLLGEEDDRLSALARDESFIPVVEAGYMGAVTTLLESTVFNLQNE